MSIVKSIFKVLRSGTWDEHYFKTSSDQVVHTKTDGQASTVKEQLDGLNSALGVERFELSNNSGTIVTSDDTRRAFGFYDKSTKTVRIYAQCKFSDNNTLVNTFRIPDQYRPKNQSIKTCIGLSINNQGAPGVIPAQITTDGYITAGGATSYSRSVLYIAEYQI